MTSERFDLAGDLPRILAIDASAGTGKTFTLASLVTRLLGEGEVSAPELLVVTFTRAATSELRSRVRGQLVEAAAHLRGTGAGDPSPVAVHLSDATEEERARRADRLEQAIVEFDLATVTTIHGFATQLLGSIGVTAGADLDATLVDDLDELLPEVCSDALAAAALAGYSSDDLPNLKAIEDALRVRLANPDMVVLPPLDEIDQVATSAAVLRRLVDRCSTQVLERRRRLGTISFDDVLVQLRDVLRDRAADEVRAAIGARFSLVLVDEFQDTDPVQWDVFSTLFGHPDASARLVLVGDPKQAIYAFRGADVHTFRKAVGQSAGVERRSLDRNWRSDGALLDALNTVFDGVTFGARDIAYTRVEPAPGHEDLRIRRRDGTPVPPLALRLALGDDLPRNPSSPHTFTADDVRSAVFADLVAQLRDLLDDAVIPVERPDRDGPTHRPVRPSDIAVLVRSGRDAAEVQRELVVQGIPAVLARGTSVLSSDAAVHLRWLLEAVGRPGDPTRARTYALSCFEDVAVQRLAELREADEESAAELVAIQERLRSWAEVLDRHGVAPFFRRVWRDSGVAARVLERADGDRLLTDLEHLVELLHVGVEGRSAGIAGLLDALSSPPVTGIEADAGLDPAARRVETDREAVQVMTIWVSKGLEFPIVCCPTLWSEFSGGEVVFHDEDSGRRTFDLSGKDWPDRKHAKDRAARAKAEVEGENLRLVYVALTRARHHCIAWWTRTTRSAGTAWAKVLFARSDGRIDPGAWEAKVEPPAAEATADALGPLVERSGGLISVDVHGRVRRPAAPWTPTDAEADGDAPELAVSSLTRRLDRSARRWSFTALASTLDVAEEPPAFVAVDPFDPSDGDAGAGDEPAPVRDGAPEGVDAVLAPEEALAEAEPDTEVTPEEVRAAPLAWLPGGTGFGTLVHSVFEDVDFTAPDLAAAFGARFDEVAGWRPVSLRVDGVPADAPAAVAVDGRDLLVDGLVRATTTPLGPAFGDRSLRDVGPADRLDELSFDLRLPGSEDRLDVRVVSALIARHLRADDPLAAWAARWAAEADAAVLAGHLTGSIDLVARVTDTDGGPRFVVVDYKTNRLHERGRSPRPGDYGRAALADAMAHSHYGLQALLYSVALHRYLRWRLPGYAPARHLGGAAYLFVRGMNGPDTPVVEGHPDGVFTWAVPSALVVELSDLLAGEVRS